nr:hypothetical protein [Capnocytophaga canimorsus]
MTDENIKSEGFALCKAFDIFRSPYAFKNPSMNFFFLIILNPL